ncbi:hypothetical protein [Reyranella sp. CPCC 100927]|uniref:hypothetical protein n=1 Tax=Reyranella sp. CPCC 100927 TaxID=2599616 RepID=UPI0011B77EA5|nr:hypothetical protein [Reyranella sp. CPCC 100927]TWT10204.1 hypothetical protein FQU96_19145 [Reyranella sp. CPCC 100927]
MFPDDDRVVAMFAEARRRFGDDILRDPRRTVPLLADQAPELRDTIKATAGAIGIGVAQRLGATRDQASEFHRLASEVAAREGVAIGDAMAGVRIAARMGGVSPAAIPPQDRSWVGGSNVVGGPGQQGMPPTPGTGPAYGGPAYGSGAAPSSAPPSGPSELLKGKWGIAALIGVGLLVVVGFSMSTDQRGPGPQPPPSRPEAAPRPEQPPPQRPPSRPEAAPQPQAPPQQGGRRPPQQSSGLPIIVPPGGNQQPPAIPLRDTQQAYILEFGASAGGQLYRVIVGVSKQGWNAGFVAVASQGANEPESVSQTGQFQLTRQNNTAIRILQPQWQRDGLDIGTMCVAFVQPQAQDVQLRGSNVCVLADNCNQMIGCGAVQ